jgi:predicted small secreted protein
MKLAVAVFLVLTLSACSTVKGVGQDITNGADWVQKKL